MERVIEWNKHLIPKQNIPYSTTLWGNPCWQALQWTLCCTLPPFFFTQLERHSVKLLGFFASVWQLKASASSIGSCSNKVKEVLVDNYMVHGPVHWSSRKTTPKHNVPDFVLDCVGGALWVILSYVKRVELIAKSPILIYLTKALFPKPSLFTGKQTNLRWACRYGFFSQGNLSAVPYQWCSWWWRWSQLLSDYEQAPPV